MFLKNLLRTMQLQIQYLYIELQHGSQAPYAASNTIAQVGTGLLAGGEDKRLELDAVRGRRELQRRPRVLGDLRLDLDERLVTGDDPLLPLVVRRLRQGGLEEQLDAALDLDVLLGLLLLLRLLLAGEPRVHGVHGGSATDFRGRAVVATLLRLRLDEHGDGVHPLLGVGGGGEEAEGDDGGDDDATDGHDNAPVLGCSVLDGRADRIPQGGCQGERNR